MTIHATAVAIGSGTSRRAVLLTGPSGAGKSDLALRLIDRGATLIADDRVVLSRDGACVLALPPPTLAGLIEVRNIGIVVMPYIVDVPIALVIDLSGTPDRLPEPATCDLLGVAIRVVVLAAFEASAPLKVERALTASGGGVD